VEVAGNENVIGKNTAVLIDITNFNRTSTFLVPKHSGK
jgi:hypothetical protein